MNKRNVTLFVVKQTLLLYNYIINAFNNNNIIIILKFIYRRFK